MLAKSHSWACDLVQVEAVLSSDLLDRYHELCGKRHVPDPIVLPQCTLSFMSHVYTQADLTLLASTDLPGLRCERHGPFDGYGRTGRRMLANFPTAATDELCPREGRDHRVALWKYHLDIWHYVDCILPGKVDPVRMSVPWLRWQSRVCSDFVHQVVQLLRKGMTDMLSDAISAVEASRNGIMQEQGRLQGAIYSARALFDALGPVAFGALYSRMKQHDPWSQATPFLLAAALHGVGISVALLIPTTKRHPNDIAESRYFTETEDESDSRGIEYADREDLSQPLLAAA